MGTTPSILTAQSYGINLRPVLFSALLWRAALVKSFLWLCSHDSILLNEKPAWFFVLKQTFGAEWSWLSCRFPLSRDICPIVVYVHEAWGLQEHHLLVTFPLLSNWDCPVGIEVSNEELTCNGCGTQVLLKNWKVKEAFLQFCFRSAGMALCCVLELGRFVLDSLSFQTQVPLYFSRSLFSFQECSGYGTTFYLKQQKGQM